MMAASPVTIIGASALAACLAAALALGAAWLRLRRALEASHAEAERLQLREAEQRLAKEQAERLAASKTAFLATMSHEIRTPMNGVIGFTELLLQSDLDEKRRTQVQLIADSGRAMMQLVNDILDHSKIESGELRLVPEPVDLRARLEHCIKLVEPVARSKHLAIGLWVDDDVPQQVQLDRLRIQQVLINLIGNAIRFTESGGIDVEARVENSTEGQSLLLSVIDTGIGIEHSRLAEIFAPYRQESRDTAALFGGSGLGLAISSELAAMMGGQISVHSRRGVGSQFTVRLPLHRLAAQGEPCAAAPCDSPGAALSALQGAHVLIVEDDEINRALIVEMAASLHLDVHVARNGADAVRAVVESDAAGIPFAAVLMDMKMPGMDGLEATRRLRALGFTPDVLPVIALTANCYPEDIAACAAAGMQSHLGKPVTSVALARELSRWLGPAAPPKACAPNGRANALEIRYRLRKQRVVESLRRMLEEASAKSYSGSATRSEAGVQAEAAADQRELARQLHKLAGVAANFGEPELGEASRRLEHQLCGQHPCAQLHQALRREWPIFARAV